LSSVYYSAIADELYLLPFLRSYANFLGLDAGATSGRFFGQNLPPDRSENKFSDRF
jgi:hypothetical protein